MGSPHQEPGFPGRVGERRHPRRHSGQVQPSGTRPGIQKGPRF